MNIIDFASIHKTIVSNEIQLQLSYKRSNIHDLYFYIILTKENKGIGYISYRSKNNIDNYYYGNIGYRIIEQYRGNNYAYKACELLKTVLQELEVKETIITVSPENIASRKTIEKLNTELIETVDVPNWHPLYINNEKIKMIYKWRIEQ